MATASGRAMQSDINITPLIDVLLVLLVIFMLTQPLLRKVLDIQVPVEQEQATQSPSTNIVLEITANGEYLINTQPVARADLGRRFHEIYDPRPDKLLFIKVDNSRPYQDVLEAIDIARGAGVKVFGLTPPSTGQAGS